MITVPEEVKKVIKSDSACYNIRIHFPNGERQDICNDLIVNGTARFTESLCSQNTLKFGLCESPTFECEVVGVSNIRGCVIQLTYELFCDANIDGSVFKKDIQHYVYEIPKGNFIIASCDRQSDMLHRKLVAYGGGSATNWDLPEYERLGRLGKTVKHEYNLFKSLLTNFNLDNFETVDSELSASKIESYWEDMYIGAFRVEFRCYYLVFEAPTNCTDIFVANYENTQTVESAILNIENAYEEKYGQPLREDALERLYVLKNLFETGNYIMPVQDNPYTYRSETDEYILRKDAVNVSKNQYFTSWVTSIYNDKYLYVPFSIKIECDGYIGPQYVRLDHEEFLIDDSQFKIMKINEELPNYYINDKYLNIRNMDLLNIFSAGIGLMGKFARFKKDNQIEFIDIKKQFDLMPSEDLEPSESLRPLGVTGESITKSMYSSCWYDENYTVPYGAVYCAYKDGNNNDRELTVYCEGYDSSSSELTYQIYNVSDNIIIKSRTYSYSEMTALLQKIADSISGVTYLPLEINSISMPYVECGDTFEVLTDRNDSINTIVLRDELNGELYVTERFISK